MLGTSTLTEEVTQEAERKEGGNGKAVSYANLLNVIKNKRRIKLAHILQGQPLSLDEIQQRLKGEGYYHSRDTIRKHYAGPMVVARLLAEENGRYRLTDVGRDIIAILGDTDLGSLFPSSSGCYEETCLLALEVPRNYDELSRYLPKADLQRTIRRLQEKGLVTKDRPDRHVTYRRATKETDVPLSKTEGKVLQSIAEDGTGVNEIAKAVGISLRRTFKYLKRLREKGLVSSTQNVTLLSLTEEGKELAEKLSRIMSAMPMELDQQSPPSEMEVEQEEAREERPHDQSSAHASQTQSVLIASSRAKIRPTERGGRFTTKRDIRERQLYDLVLDAGDVGVVQSDLSTILSLPNREISRICSRLESWGLIRKDEVINEGRRTFRIESTRKPPSLNSILGSPCITCPNTRMCEESNELEPLPYKMMSPQECQQLERWLIGNEIGEKIDRSTNPSS